MMGCAWCCCYVLCGCVNGAYPARFVLTLFVRSRASQTATAGLPNKLNRAPISGGRDCVDTICAYICSIPTSCRLCLLGTPTSCRRCLLGTHAPNTKYNKTDTYSRAIGKQTGRSSLQTPRLLTLTFNHRRTYTLQTPSSQTSFSTQTNRTSQKARCTPHANYSQNT